MNEKDFTKYLIAGFGAFIKNMNNDIMTQIPARINKIFDEDIFHEEYLKTFESMFFSKLILDPLAIDYGIENGYIVESNTSECNKPSAIEAHNIQTYRFTDKCRNAFESVLIGYLNL